MTLKTTSEGLDLDFILDHFDFPETETEKGSICPRTISTKTTEGRLILVDSREEALARFKQANYLDCRISAYSDYTQWNGINREAPNLIFSLPSSNRWKASRGPYLIF
jgi:hypothetical protein